MAIASPPTTILAERAQSLTVTVTLSSATDVTGWTATARLRYYDGATPFATKTIGSGITVSDYTNGVFVISFSSTDLDQTPGQYLLEFDRTNSGYEYPILDPSPFIIRSSGSGSNPTLTNLSEWAAHTQFGTSIPDADAKALVQQLAAAEELIQRFCGRRFTYKASQTFYLDGNGMTDVLIPQTPVQSVSSVKVDYAGYYGDAPNAFSGDALTVGEDYVLVKDDPDNTGWSKSGVLRRIGTVWPYWMRQRGTLTPIKEKCPGSIKVVATCGYTLIPMPIKLAVWNTTTLMRRAAIRGQLPSSQSGEGYSRSFGSMEAEVKQLDSVRNLLNLYRRPVV